MAGSSSFSALKNMANRGMSREPGPELAESRQALADKVQPEHPQAQPMAPVGPAAPSPVIDKQDLIQRLLAAIQGPAMAGQTEGALRGELGIRGR